MSLQTETVLVLDEHLLSLLKVLELLDVPLLWWRLNHDWNLIFDFI